MWGTLNSQLQMLLGLKGRFTSKLINFGYSLDAKSVSCKCLLLSERKRDRESEREVEEGRVTKIRTGRETQRNRLSRVQAKKICAKEK